MEVPEVVVGLSGMVFALRLHIKPDAGEMVNDKFTVPVKPFTPVAVIVDMPVAPALMVTVAGLALRVKSTTLTMTVLLVLPL